MQLVFDRALQQRIYARMWWLIVALFLLDTLWQRLAGLPTRVEETLPIALPCAVCLAISLFYRYGRSEPALSLMAGLVVQTLAGVYVLAIFSYLANSLALPLRDAQLAATDADLGFHWHDWIGWLAERPSLAAILNLAYASSGPQMAVVIFALFCRGKLLDAQRFIVAFFYASILAIILSSLLPAWANYGAFPPDPAMLGNIDNTGGTIHLKLVAALRDHTLPAISLPFVGIVTYPSFHTTMAILCAWGCRSLPWLYRLMIPHSVLVTLSTMPCGGHYLTDVIGGLLVAFHTIYMARRIIPELSSLRAQRSNPAIR